MPIYPYICNACGHEFDQLQKIGDESLRQCPECHEEALRKKLTAPSFRLKGTGWYETDFKDKRAKKDGDKEGDKEGNKKETKDKTEVAKSDGKDDKKEAGKKTDSKSSSTAAGSDSAGSKPSTSKSADST